MLMAGSADGGGCTWQGWGQDASGDGGGLAGSTGTRHPGRAATASTSLRACACVTVSVSPCVCHRACAHTDVLAGPRRRCLCTPSWCESTRCHSSHYSATQAAQARTCGTHGCTRSPSDSRTASPELPVLPRPRVAAQTRLGTPGPSRSPSEPGAAPRHRISTRAAPGDKWELSEAPCLLLTFGNATAPRAVRAGGSGPAGIVAHHLQLISSR